MKAQVNVSDVLLGYYVKNKKKLLQEAIKNNNVQLTNSLIKLYESLGESLDDIFCDVEVIEKVAEKTMVKEKEEEENLSIIFARKLR